MLRIAADENLHALFYRDILTAAIALRPSAAVRAIVAEVLAFDMPGTAIPGYLRKAAQLARAGIFDLRIHHDDVLMPILRHWRIFELEGLDPEAELDRERLAAYLVEPGCVRAPVRGAEGGRQRASAAPELSRPVPHAPRRAPGTPGVRSLSSRHLRAESPLGDRRCLAS